MVSKEANDKYRGKTPQDSVGKEVSYGDECARKRVRKFRGGREGDCFG